MIKKGTYVRIQKVILNPSERPKTIPKDTQQTPLLMWTKGYLTKDSNIGDIAEITTINGRKESGILVDINHIQNIDYGSFVNELNYIGTEVKKVLFDE